MDEDRIEQNDGRREKDLVWWLSCIAVTAVAGFFRFFLLGLKPLHHDEGVNGFFLTNLVRDGVYKYDPANYHGPTLYYIAYPFVKLFGLETIPVRVSVAIWGVLIVVLAFYLRPYIGRIGSIFAALFLALSPGMVYVSRYFIHEIFFIFLSLALVVTIICFIEQRKAGVLAIGWLMLLLAVCFIPSGLMLADYLGGESSAATWSFRIAFLVIDGVLLFWVMRMIAGWNDGRYVYLLLASASIALLFATKETGFITLGTMAISFLCVWMWRPIRDGVFSERNYLKVVVATHILGALAALYFREAITGGFKWLYENFLGDGKVQRPFVLYTILLLLFGTAAAWIIFLIANRNSTQEAEQITDEQLTWPRFRTALTSRGNLWLALAALTAVFIYISLLFFTSFFTYGEGPSKAIEAYTIWTKTGSKEHTQNGPFAYLKWGMKVEAPILILSALGAAIALVKGRHRFAIFTAFWAFGLFLAYTIIPYKTPWLALSFLLPMCLVAGYGIGQMLTTGNVGLKIAGVILAVSGTSILAFQTYDLNFVRYDDEEMGYVYAHTKRGFIDLIKNVEHYADKSGKGKDATIEVVSPDYWPMTWYLNTYAHANFQGQLVDANTSEMIITKKNDQDVEAIRRYSAHYKYVGVWPLRPGVDLVLLVRKDLANPSAQELYRVTEWVSPELRR